jgi:hypothetical protein
MQMPINEGLFMQTRIVKWLEKNKHRFNEIAATASVSVPSLYDIVKTPHRPKRQKRIIDSVTAAYNAEKDKSK